MSRDEDEEHTHPGAGAPPLERIAASLAVLHRASQERSELLRTILVTQRDRDKKEAERAAAVVAVIKAPATALTTVVHAITQGNQIAQTVLAVGLVVFVLSLVGVQVADINVNELILGLTGRQDCQDVQPK